MSRDKGDRSVQVAKREKHAIWWFLEFTVIPIMWLLVSIKRFGTENVPREGAFVIAPNHTSNIDPIVMGVGVFRAGRTPHFLGKASLFRVAGLKWLLRVTGQIPVDRSKPARDSDPLSSATLVAESGSGVIVYPEGTLTRDPNLWPMRGKTGAVRLALTAGIPLIPAAHWGTERFLPPYAKFPKLFPRKRINVVFGPPVDLTAFEGKALDNKVVHEATEVLMAAITALVAEQRGEVAPATRWDPVAHNQSEFGHP